MHVPQALFQETSFGVIARQFERASVARGGVSVRSTSAQKVRAGGVQQVVIIKLAGGHQFVNQAKAALRPVRHGHSNGAIKRDNRRWLKARQSIVKLYDLSPISLFRALSFTMFAAIAASTAYVPATGAPFSCRPRRWRSAW
ncbi:MAG: hypothetical protein ACXW3W_14910 [Pyrinomonadaceae bacterium]